MTSVLKITTIYGFSVMYYFLNYQQIIPLLQSFCLLFSWLLWVNWRYFPTGFGSALVLLILAFFIDNMFLERAKRWTSVSNIRDNK